MQLNYKIIGGVLHLFWEGCPGAHHYRIMAMSEVFVYYSIDITSDLSSDLPMDKHGSYIRFKIVGESVNNNVLAESNEVNILYSEIEKFKITALNGYNGTTLGFRSKGVYDLYKVYNKNILIAETEDPILELRYKVTKKELGELLVEGYLKSDDKYILGGISDGIIQLPGRGKSDYKISVVVPVYKAEVFLPRTVDSILSSSMSDIEIILVDDGSTDNSLNICNWYAKNFPCVSVIHQSNQGVSVARNVGIKVASGEYLGFVDSDDIVHPFMYEKLYNTCDLEKADIAISSVIIHNDIRVRGSCLNMSGKSENLVVYSYTELINNMHKKDNMYFVAVWNKIVKTSVAKKVKFPVEYPSNVVLYEDCAYTPTLYSYIDKFAFCKDAYYIWDKRQRKTIGTLSTKYKSENTNSVRKSFIYAYAYPIYNSCKKHKELCDYACFRDLIQSYDKFTKKSPLYSYWNEKLRELIKSEKLNKNKYIMNDDHLKNVINKLGD